MEPLLTEINEQKKLVAIHTNTINDLRSEIVDCRYNEDQLNKCVIFLQSQVSELQKKLVNVKMELQKEKKQSEIFIDVAMNGTAW